MRRVLALALALAFSACAHARPPRVNDEVAAPMTAADVRAHDARAGEPAPASGPASAPGQR
jgi:hypothetical protein